MSNNLSYAIIVTQKLIAEIQLSFKKQNTKQSNFSTWLVTSYIYIFRVQGCQLGDSYIPDSHLFSVPGDRSARQHGHLYSDPQ